MERLSKDGIQPKIHKGKAAKFYNIRKSYILRELWNVQS